MQKKSSAKAGGFGDRTTVGEGDGHSHVVRRVALRRSWDGKTHRPMAPAPHGGAVDAHNEGGLDKVELGWGARLDCPGELRGPRMSVVDEGAVGGIERRAVDGEVERREGGRPERGGAEGAEGQEKHCKAQVQQVALRSRGYLVSKIMQRSIALAVPWCTTKRSICGA